MVRYNWKHLQTEFIQGDWLTLRSYFQSKDIPYNSRTRTNAKGWKNQKLQYEKEILLKSKEKFIVEEVEVRTRQQKEAVLLQIQGLRYLKSLPINSISEARKLIELGLETERLALGFNSDGKSQKLIVNTPLPKTNLDIWVEHASAEEIFTLLAKIREEKQRRQVTTT